MSVEPGTDWFIRSAAGRTDSSTVRLSLPADVVDALDVSAGEELVVFIDPEGRVRVATVSDFFG